MIKLDKLENIDVPARYTGGEARQVIKNSNMVENRVCVAIPMMYEIGTFDFDLKSLYYILNVRRDTWCERVFAPMKDFEILLKRENEKLYTLESKTPLKNMDVLIFIITSEMSYTNVLNMMNLGGIPIHKHKRKEGFPLVVFAGSGVNNPIPMEPFADLYIIGEPATVINDFMTEYTKLKKIRNLAKENMLDALKDMHGVYIPGISTGTIRMTCEEDIDAEIVPRSMVVPSIKTMIDETVVTLSKGCDKNCIMCAHKYAYGVPQYMDVDKAVIKTKRLMNATGCTDVMLMSNCYATYPGFPDIIYKLKDLQRPEVKNITFMEVKLTKNNLWILKYMEDKENYPSIIVGGGTEKLRNKIGIEITDEDIMYISRKVFEEGFTKIRLKYILGIPGENYEDFPKMLDMANKICKIYKEVYSKSPDKYIVELNIYNFSAKPHTPSQWCSVNSSENLEIKLRYLKDRNRNENVIITSAEPKQAEIENMLSRGDKSVSQVIYDAWKLGARHDMFEGCFSYDNWQVALNKNNVDVKKYLEEINEKLELPWDFIELKTPKDEIRRKYLKLMKGM